MKNIVGYEIKTLDNLIERKIIKACKTKEGCVLTPIQAHILKYLQDNKELYQRDLEKKLKFRRSTSLGILKTMEKNGLIIRTNLDNNRLKKVIITIEGIKVAKKIKDYMVKFEQMLTKDINKDDLETFFNVIYKIKNNIKEEDKYDKAI